MQDAHRTTRPDDLGHGQVLLEQLTSVLLGEGEDYREDVASGDTLRLRELRRMGYYAARLAGVPVRVVVGSPHPAADGTSTTRVTVARVR